MKEEDTVTLPAYSLVDRSYNELLDEQFDKGWDAGVQAAFDIVQEVLGSGADLAAICARFMRELDVELRQEQLHGRPLGRRRA